MLRMWIAFSHSVDRIADNERGAGLAEYALIVALIAIFAIGALEVLGGAISTYLGDITTLFNNTGPTDGTGL